MNENEKPIQPEKSGLDEKKKSALLRYVAIMFAVAFVLVLFSLLGQMRNSMSTISELNQSSSSALQKAEQLQEHNLELELENQELSMEVEDLQEAHAELDAQLAALQQQLDNSDDQNGDLQEDYNLLKQELDQIRLEQTAQAEYYNETVQAYDRLTELMYAIVSGEATAEAVAPEYEKIESYLGDTARQTFENLCSRGE